MTTISISNLTAAYNVADNLLPVIKQTTLQFAANTFNLLIGPSGSGKSTFLKCIAGLYPEYGGTISGNILLDNQSISSYSIRTRSQKVGMLFQNPSEQFAMKTPLHEIIFTLENLSIPPEEIDVRAQEALAFVGITNLAHRALATLSGGEAQKVALAVVLAMKSDIILLDEPFASVDPDARLDLLEKLKTLQQQGHTIIISDHDLTGYQALYTNIYKIENQQIISINQPSKLFEPFDQLTASFSLPVGNEATIINTNDLLITVGEKKLLALKSLNFLQNKMTLITGPNGVGKSTLFGTLTKLHAYDGEIIYSHTNIKKIKKAKYTREVALVFQQAEMQFLKMTVQEELELSLKYAKFPEFWTPESIKQILLSLNMANMEEHVVYQLSGGQKKKLQILIMLIIGTPVMLLDEPLAGLDLLSVTTIMTLLKKMTFKQKQTVLMISHQLTGIPEFFDYHLVFNHQTLTYKENL